MNNKQVYGVIYKDTLNLQTFEDRIEYYFGHFSRIAEGNYNIYPTTKHSISGLEVFDFTMDRFILSDLLELILEHIDINDPIHLNEFVVKLKWTEMLEDAEDNNIDTESDEHWEWTHIESTFAGLYEKNIELQPQGSYKIEDGIIHVHFKLGKV